MTAPRLVVVVEVACCATVVVQVQLFRVEQVEDLVEGADVL